MALIAFGLGAVLGCLFGAFVMSALKIGRSGEDQGYLSEGLFR